MLHGYVTDRLLMVYMLKAYVVYDGQVFVVCGSNLRRTCSAFFSQLRYVKRAALVSRRRKSLHQHLYLHLSLQ